MTLNIAHRGFSALYPENTMLAFEKAKIEGFCDGIELDVQLTKDNIPVIIHDEELERTTGIKGLVKDITYSEIRKLNAGLNQKIPSLEEYLEFAKEKKIFTNLELKNSILEYKGLEDISLNLIHKLGLEKDIILSSFNHESMIKVKELDENMKTGLLYDCLLFNPQKYCKSCGADAMHPNFRSLLLSKKSLKNMLDSGIDVNSYTINKEKHMIKFINEGISAIITNHPDKLHEILKSNLK
ncbi:glycerophosphodiester phosphodiesterase family protein [uncultured Clostridium sp.]|jgi:glycerophosphoryl diester phosphodiesterase|uniref:glycerophosphodiester phosphodiesterase family protein n=1 Tax=uncultured Clostridium sp. TaxID=59620 RepID=UPI002637A133|nr:glycerophosphodiester phosphodiesterase family protein [uncultured Clostridium sp.]